MVEKDFSCGGARLNEPRSSGMPLKFNLHVPETCGHDAFHAYHALCATVRVSTCSSIAALYRPRVEAHRYGDW